MTSDKKGSLTFSQPVERGAQRFRELIVYISNKCERDQYFGAIKLNKILYYSDFRAYERFGVSLTGRPYFRLKFGPAPRPLVIIQGELIEEGAIRLEQAPGPGGFEQKRTIALRAPVLEHFTGDELALVDQVIADLWNQTAAEVSDASHDIRWRVLEDRDGLPYEFAFLSNEFVTELDISRTRELASELGWESR